MTDQVKNTLHAFAEEWTRQAVWRGYTLQDLGCSGPRSWRFRILGVVDVEFDVVQMPGCKPQASVRVTENTRRLFNGLPGLTVFDAEDQVLMFEQDRSGSVFEHEDVFEV